MSAPCPTFGFIVTVAPAPATSTAQRDALVDSLIDVLDQNDLSVTGNRGHPLEFVVHREGSQATHTDRELVLTWADRWTDRATIAVGDLVDLSRSS